MSQLYIQVCYFPHQDRVYWSKIILWDVTESLKKLESKFNQSRSDQYKSAFYWATEEQQISCVSFSISVNDKC